jgi:hypothetical protein
VKVYAGKADLAIGDGLDVSIPMIEHVCKRLIPENLEAAFSPRRTYGRKLDGKQEAQLIAPACVSSVRVVNVGVQAYCR